MFWYLKFFLDYLYKNKNQIKKKTNKKKYLKNKLFVMF